MVGVFSIMAVTVAVGGWTWRRRAIDQRVDEALAALERRGGPPIDSDLIPALDGDSRYKLESQLLRGIVQMRAGEPEAALRILGSLRPEGKIRFPLLLAVGEAYYRAGRFTDAERIYLQVADEKPASAAAHRWLATIYHELGAMQASGRELLKVAELEPDDFFAYRLMGLLYLKDYGKHQEAADVYRMALARNPPAKHLQAIRTELAESLVGLSDYAGALEVLEAAEEDSLVLGIKAECRWSRGEIDEAARLLERAKALNPDARAVLFLSASMAMEGKNPEAALEPLRTLIERDPLDHQACYLLMGAYQRLGDKAAVAAEVKRMDEAKARRKKLADLYSEVMQRPRDAEIREELAELCDQFGKPGMARIWRRAADELRRPAGIIDLEP